MKKIIGIVMVLLMLMSVTVALAGNTKDTQPGGEKVKVIIGFVDKPNQADEDVIRGHGGKTKYTYHIINAKAVEMPEQAIDRIKKNPRVKYVEPDYEVHTLQELQWGVDRIDADLVWDHNSGTGVKVCIIDTGIDYTHPDLDANYKGGCDFVNNDADPKDDNGHGTHCAGIIAAEYDCLGVVGVAPEANLYAAKVLDRRGSGWLSDVIAGMGWAVDNNMDVVSMSLGTSSYSDSLKIACDSAFSAGLVLVASAGNGGDGDPNTNEISYPAAYDSVIAVGATDSSDDAPYWSNSGDHLELASPGVNIYSTMPTYTVWLNIIYGVSKNYGTLSGTSMACPHVAGAAALIIASDPELTNVDVRNRLKTTADDLDPDGRDTVYGYGLVDAYKAAAPGVDIIPPTISLVDASGITSSSANITWTTDEASDSVVRTYTSPAIEVSDPAMVTSHSVALTGLSEGTTYYYEVESEDAVGNTVTDNNSGVYYNFTTTSPDTEAPKITDATGNTTGTTGEPVTISATITDDVDVVSATVYYTPIGATETSVSMTEGANDWSTDVPVASDEVGLITYYITAQDAAPKTARDPTGGTYSITVADDDAPLAEAGSDQSVLVNEEVTFNGSDSSDNIEITSHSWDFDASNGIQEDATSETAIHPYSATGTYTVTLTVRDGADNEDSDTLTVTVSETSAEVVEFKDSFEDGEWNGLWAEDSQNDWFRSTQRATDGSYSAEVDGRATDATLTMANPINLSGKTSATLTFSWFIEEYFDGGEYIAIDVYNGSWYEIKRLSGNVDGENMWHDEDIDLSTYMASDFKIRFRAKVSNAREDGNIDNVTITSHTS